MEIKLSVAIITFNEENNIRRCLDSVKEIADDIVVIDSFSTDKTEEICISEGARFIKNKFPGHIEQKNFAAEHAQYKHVLSLDADEALSNELKESILKAKKNWKHDGYKMNRLTNYCGKWIKHCGWYPDTKLRLWDRDKGKWGGINPHDRYEMNANASITKLKGDILHYSYYSINDHIAQVNTFTEISANILFKKNKGASLLKILISPFVKFLRDYFFKLGFLDGFYGFTICMISSHATFLKYVKLRQLHTNRRKKH